MSKRATTWLLAALLALAANAAVPAVRGREGGGNPAIVWIARDRAEQRVLVQSRSVQVHARPALPLNYDPPAKARHFAPSLYQRPPPSLR